MKVVLDFHVKFPTCPERTGAIPRSLLQASERTDSHVTENTEEEDSHYRYLKNLLGHAVDWHGPAYAMV